MYLPSFYQQTPFPYSTIWVIVPNKKNTYVGKVRQEVSLKISLRYCIIKGISMYNIAKILKVPIPILKYCSAIPSRPLPNRAGNT